MFDISSFMLGICIGVIIGIIAEKLISLNRFKKKVSEEVQDPTETEDINNILEKEDKNE